MEIKENTKIQLCGFVEAAEDKHAELEESIRDLKTDVANTIAQFMAIESTRIVTDKSYYDLRRERDNIHAELVEADARLKKARRERKLQGYKWRNLRRIRRHYKPRSIYKITR